MAPRSSQKKSLPSSRRILASNPLKVMFSPSQRRIIRKATGQKVAGIVVAPAPQVRRKKLGKVHAPWWESSTWLIGRGGW